MRSITNLIARQRSVDATAGGRCARCGASPHSLIPIALMCSFCRARSGDQSWRAPISLRSG